MVSSSGGTPLSRASLTSQTAKEAATIASRKSEKTPNACNIDMNISNNKEGPSACYDGASAKDTPEHEDRDVFRASGRSRRTTREPGKIQSQEGQSEVDVKSSPQLAAIASLIDHTLLRPDATARRHPQSVPRSAQYGFASVCVNPYWVPLVASELAGSPVKVCTVVGFPLGANATAIKVAETENRRARRARRKSTW